MSAETDLHLNTNVLIGFTDKRGTAWHYRADFQTIDPVTGHVGNHYPGPIPIDHVNTRLFNWEALSSPIFTLVPNPDYDPDGQEGINNPPEIMRPVEGKQLLTHSGTDIDLGIHNVTYEIHQYQEWLVNVFGRLLDDSDLGIASAGLLAKGAQAWVSLELPDTIGTPEGVEFRPFLLGATSHDGSISTIYKRAMQFVVCDNTLSMALREKGQQYKIRHTRNSSVRLPEARDALNLLYVDAENFAEEVKELCALTVTDKQWSEFLDAHIPLPEEDGVGRTKAGNKRDEWTELWNSDPRVSPWKNTAFGVLQAGNTWNTHIAAFKTSKNTRGSRNMTNFISGASDAHDNKVLNNLYKVLDLDTSDLVGASLFSEEDE